MIFEIVILFLSGLISGLYSTFAGGAALLTIPVLVLLGVGAASAVATNRLVVLLMAITRIPFVKGKLGIGVGIPFLIILVHTLGAILGALILVNFEESISLFVLGLIMVLGGGLTYYSPKAEKTKQREEMTMFSIAISTLCMGAIGVYRGFFGPAAGTLNRLVLLHLLGLNFTQTLTLTTYASLFSSLAALVIFFNAGIINTVYGFPLAIGAILGIIISTKLALAKGESFMKNTFAGISILFGIYFMVR